MQITSTASREQIRGPDRAGGTGVVTFAVDATLLDYSRIFSGLRNYRREIVTKKRRPRKLGRLVDLKFRILYCWSINL
jgi:hypothetical protein